MNCVVRGISNFVSNYVPNPSKSSKTTKICVVAAALFLAKAHVVESFVVKTTFRQFAIGLVTIGAIVALCRRIFAKTHHQEESQSLRTPRNSQPVDDVPMFRFGPASQYSASPLKEPGSDRICGACFGIGIDCTCAGVGPAAADAPVIPSAAADPADGKPAAAPDRTSCSGCYAPSASCVCARLAASSTAAAAGAPFVRLTAAAPTDSSSAGTERKLF